MDLGPRTKEDRLRIKIQNIRRRLVSSAISEDERQRAKRRLETTEAELGALQGRRRPRTPIHEPA